MTLPQVGRIFLRLVVSFVSLLLIGCADSSEIGTSIEKITASPTQVSLHWQDSSGEPYRQLENLRSDLESQGEEILMLMNAGIYEPGETPTGNGQQLVPLNTNRVKVTSTPNLTVQHKL